MRSTTRIKAKPTKYCGVQFRSKTEAKYTALFNRFDEPWTYEPQRFNLPSGSYLPDFFLPRLNAWVEIKGVEPTHLEIRLCEELYEYTGKDVYIAYGWPPVTEPNTPGLYNIIKSSHKYFWSLQTSFWCLSEGKLTIATATKNWIWANGLLKPIGDLSEIEAKFKKRVRTPSSKKR